MSVCSVSQVPALHNSPETALHHILCTSPLSQSGCLTYWTAAIGPKERSSEPNGVEILSGLHEGDHVITTVSDSVRQGAKVRPRLQAEPGESNGKGGAQTNKVPNAGPNEYGDQSIVNQSSDSTNNQGKKGSGSGSSGGSGGTSGAKNNAPKSQKEDTGKQ